MSGIHHCYSQFSYWRHAKSSKPACAGQACTQEGEASEDLAEFGQQHVQGSLPCSDDAGGWEASELSSKERRQLRFTAEGTSPGGGGASSLLCVCDAPRAPSRAFPAESPQQDVTSQHSNRLCVPDTLHNSAHVLRLPQASAHFPL